MSLGNITARMLLPAPHQKQHQFSSTAIFHVHLVLFLPQILFFWQFHVFHSGEDCYYLSNDTYLKFYLGSATIACAMEGWRRNPWKPREDAISITLSLPAAFVAHFKTKRWFIYWRTKMDHFLLWFCHLTEKRFEGTVDQDEQSWPLMSCPLSAF